METLREAGEAMGRGGCSLVKKYLSTEAPVRIQL